MLYKFFLKFVLKVRFGTIRHASISVPVNAIGCLDFCANKCYRFPRFLCWLCLEIIILLGNFPTSKFWNFFSPGSKSLQTLALSKLFFSPKNLFWKWTHWMNFCLALAFLFMETSPINLTVKIRLDLGFTLNAQLNKN